MTRAKLDKLTKKGMHKVATTLYLRVAPGGSRSWIQRLLINGRRVDIGLGGYPVTSLEDAQAAAFLNRQKVKRGESDSLVRQDQSKSEAIPTFQEAAKIVITLHAPTWKDSGKTVGSWEQTFRDYVNPMFGRKKISDVTAKDVHGVVAPLWTTKPHTGAKVRQRIGAVLKWAMVQGHRMDNPCDALSSVLPKNDSLKGNFKSIHYSEVPAALDTIRKTSAFPTTILCLEFQIVTATRPSEARLMEWLECNLDEKTWTIPASRTKTGKVFRVPLSNRAMEILGAAKEYKKPDLDVVFPSARGGTLSDSTVSKLFRQSGINGVPHAVARSCFRSWCADSNIARELAESCLAHILGKTEAAYQRSDMFRQRAVIMQKWSDYLAGQTLAKVVNL